MGNISQNVKDLKFLNPVTNIDDIILVPTTIHPSAKYKSGFGVFSLKISVIYTLELFGCNIIFLELVNIRRTSRSVITNVNLFVIV